jgi:lipopolysaccharide transport system ATP-binding protein
MQPAIRVEQLSKRYRLGSADTASYRTLRESASATTQALWNRLKSARVVGRAGRSDEEPHHDVSFWALKDVSFEVEPGQVVGIIGRNGAGKSTLLKILSQIVEPTQGRAEFQGRISSLLEVGTGFHHELSGRENVYLNGAVLGMKRREISRKFDDIVDFAGIGPFLDTPLKRYSSGMQVRLAFAVAAYLEPEILIVDEVLAVGDMEFQRKCLGRMETISRSGRTILFVSHNMSAVESLCSRGILLEKGRLTYAGDKTEAIRRYMSQMEQALPHAHFVFDENEVSEDERRGGARIQEARITSKDEYSTIGYLPGAPLEFRIRGSSPKPISPRLGIGIENATGLRILTLHSDFTPRRLRAIPSLKEFEFECRVEGLALMPGDYRVQLTLLGEQGPLDVREDVMSLTILPADFYQNGGRRGQGIILCNQTWELQSRSQS